jgi:2-hydroxy-6-oxonona-2,4-dienedioate hydrolase
MEGSKKGGETPSLIKGEPLMAATNLDVRTTPLMNSPRSIEVNGINTSYHDAGSGETIVFVYGGQVGSPEAASSAHVWDLNFVPLSKRFRTVAFDKVGQGYSDMPLRDEDYTMRVVVDHAAAFIRTLGVEGGVHLVGHSRGGYIVTRLTLDYPELVKTVTIVASGSLSPTISPNELTLSGNPHAPYSRESSRWVYEGYCHDPRAVTDEWVDRSWEACNLPSVKIGVQKMVHEALFSLSFIPELAKQKRETLNWIREGRLQRPINIIWGANDRTVELEGGLQLFQMMSAHQRRTEYALFNHCGHFPYKEHPARFNANLSRFIDQMSK